ncbi:hypothetical protein [Luteibacter anthropi]|nr:hypothetical protein [Luteibacter anthropi]
MKANLKGLVQWLKLENGKGMMLLNGLVLGLLEHYKGLEFGQVTL